MNNLWKQTIAPSLSLFTSLGTLVCCALPALFVTLGMGATLAGIVSTAPWLVALSAHKKIVFAMAGIMLAIAGTVQWKMRHAPCPADPKQAKACMRFRKFSWWVLGISVTVYVIGFFFAFLAVKVLS